MPRWLRIVLAILILAGIAAGLYAFVHRSPEPGLPPIKPAMPDVRSTCPAWWALPEDQRKDMPRLCAELGPQGGK
jgi:hypothetical protein